MKRGSFGIANMSKQIKQPLQFTKLQLHIGFWAAVFGIISALFFFQSQTFSMVIPRPSDSILQQSLGNIFALASLIAWVVFIIIVIVRKFKKL